jgi:hypothetical protein
MLSRWMPLLPAMLAVLSLSSTATAQRAPNPGSTTWIVELNGQLNPNEHFVYVPFVFGNGTWGMWFNVEGERLWGFGTYIWDPTAGTIDYENRSDDGGGGQTGQYTWDGTKYERTRASHPEAPRLSLHPAQ